MGLGKTVSIKWDQGLSFDGRSGSGHTLRLDGKGNVTGFSPMELLLMGLAGCTGMDVIDILRKKQQAVSAFEVKVSGIQCKEHPKVYTDIEIEYVVRGQNIDPKAVERAIELSQTKYCSAQAMLSKAAKIRSTYRIEAAEAEHAPA